MTALHEQSRWRCPCCSSTAVQISLPTWYRETRDYCLEFEQTDEGAEALWWICDDCEESGQGEPIDVNEEPPPEPDPWAWLAQWPGTEGRT